MKLLIFFLIFLLFIFITGLIIGHYFYHLALNPFSDKSSVLKAPHNEIHKAKDSTSTEEWFLAACSEEEYINSYDNLALHAYKIIHPDTDKWALLAHGYTGSAKQMHKIAKKFYELGYSLLIPDARGHGKSKGTYIGMGWHERKDMVQWIDTLIAKEGNDIQILLYGVSMGGATVMMTSGENLPVNVKAIIEDCGYTSVKEEFSYQLKELFGLPAFPIIHFASIVTYFRTGYTLGEASAVKQLKKSKTPTLFIHGDSDTFVPSYMLNIAYETAAVEKDKLLVKGAGHGGASEIAGKIYWETIERFTAKYIN